MSIEHASRILLAAAIVLVAAVACEPTPSEPESSADPVAAPLFDRQLSPQVVQQLAKLRRYSAPLHNLERAEEAGFDVLITDCRENPGVGGMGYHYANLSRIDGAPPTLLEPEILVFAPRRNGSLGLGAVEYIIPFGLWTEAAPPTLFGETFRANNVDGVWQLHVWLWKHNPAGLFEDWNPRVSCG
ncbi:MAG: hypothetical protein HKO53_01865 [Gemmatimonadetes bacterium]|nr:hypothetical protein [Gemmatimonadota bacterium]